MIYEVTLVVSMFLWSDEGTIIRHDEDSKIYGFLNQSACESFVNAEKEKAQKVRDDHPFSFKQPRLYIAGVCLPAIEPHNKKGQMV